MLREQLTDQDRKFKEGLPENRMVDLTAEGRVGVH